MTAIPVTQTGVIPGTSRRVRSELVPQTAAMREAFEAHFHKPLIVTDGWRSYDEQVALFKRYYTTSVLSGQPRRLWNGQWWYQRVGYPSAAVPGNGEHPAGLAMDLGSGVNSSLTSPEHLWMRANGPQFGWYHPTWAHDHNSNNGTDEPWHFEAQPKAVPVSNYITVPGTGTIDLPTGVLPAPINPEDELNNDEAALLKAAHDNAAEARRLAGQAVDEVHGVADQLVDLKGAIDAVYRNAVAANENAAEARRLAGDPKAVAEAVIAALPKDVELTSKDVEDAVRKVLRSV